MNPAFDVGTAASPLAELWARLSRPLGVTAAVEALVGLPTPVTRQFVGASIAGSDAADHLLDRMPMLLRSLSIATVTTPERTVGEIRGPVLWHETMSARSATAGDPGIFVCATPARAYDTPENRVLAGALGIIQRAGKDVERGAPNDDGALRRARQNGARAGRYLEHRSLSGLATSRPDRRSIQRTRAGHRRRIYTPALDVLALSEEPIGPDDLEPFIDAHTRAQHDLLMAVVRRLETLGVRLPPFHAEAGELTAGVLGYRHTRKRGPDAGPTGVRLGRVLMDVPDDGEGSDDALISLTRRTPSHLEAHLVLGREDLHRAVERAVQLGLEG